MLWKASITARFLYRKSSRHEGDKRYVRARRTVDIRGCLRQANRPPSRTSALSFDGGTNRFGSSSVADESPAKWSALGKDLDPCLQAPARRGLWSVLEFVPGTAQGYEVVAGQKLPCSIFVQLPQVHGIGVIQYMDKIRGSVSAHYAGKLFREEKVFVGIACPFAKGSGRS